MGAGGTRHPLAGNDPCRLFPPRRPLYVERFRSLDPLHTPGVLVKNHGPFAWGRDAHEAVYNATVLEQVAKMAFITKLLNPTAGIDPLLVEKHFRRKHGPDAYYGQK